jgi:hypothetical protein
LIGRIGVKVEGENILWISIEIKYVDIAPARTSVVVVVLMEDRENVASTTDGCNCLY